MSGLHLVSNTASHYLIAWRPSTDAAGIRHYVVLVDGFLVGRVTGPYITLPWPPGGAEILVQVAAVDNNGLQGEWRAIIVIPPPPYQLRPTASDRPASTVPMSIDPAGRATSPTATSTTTNPGTTDAPTETSPDPTTSASEPTPSELPSSTAPAPSDTPTSTTPAPSTDPTPSVSPSEAPSSTCPSAPDVTVTATGTPAPVDPSASVPTLDPTADPTASTDPVC